MNTSTHPKYLELKTRLAFCGYSFLATTVNSVKNSNNNNLEEDKISTANHLARWMPNSPVDSIAQQNNSVTHAPERAQPRRTKLA
jgi:hypothetical protein